MTQLDDDATPAPPETGLTRAEERRLAKRDSILRASRELVSESGFSETQVSQIAIRAGVAVGTIYKHFESRGELFGELYRQIAEREFAVVEAAVRDEDGVPAKIATAVATFCTRALQAGRLAYALLVEPVEPIVDEHRLRLREGYREMFVTLMESSPGEVSPPDVDVAAAALLGIMTESLVRPLQEPERIDDPSRLISAIIRICLLATGVSEDVAAAEADRWRARRGSNPASAEP